MFESRTALRKARDLEAMGGPEAFSEATSLRSLLTSYDRFFCMLNMDVHPYGCKCFACTITKSSITEEIDYV